VAANIDFSEIENPTRAKTLRTQPQPGALTLNDVFIDVADESEIQPVASVAPDPFLGISRLDQFSLLTVMLVLCAAFLADRMFAGSSPEQPRKLAAYQVELNSAGLEELVLLEGIGELTAHRIILDRTANGWFVSEDHLERVKGIGPKTMDRLRDHIECR
jgi:competence ComEA-like helix-hairpin-helix protein